jgi:hypothetical protein
MSTPHETISGTDVYGPGTFIDKKVLPVPKDAKRVFEFLASQTPGFTQNKAAWDTVHFEGQSMPMIPGPIKSAVMASAIHAMIGLVANELLELRDGKAVIDSSVTVDTDHAGLWLGSVFTTYIDGLDLSSSSKAQGSLKIMQDEQIGCFPSHLTYFRRQVLHAYIGLSSMHAKVIASWVFSNTIRSQFFHFYRL